MTNDAVTPVPSSLQKTQPVESHRPVASHVSRPATCSARMSRIYDAAARVAPFDCTVLITGESGVGKERLARFIHDHSVRRRGPFVAVNCGACTDTLLDSELFGHARGAFTGAVQDRAGLFEAAEGGTLFLDEIGDVSPAMQLKCLRVLQERELRRVGETRIRRLDVRIVAATNRDLQNEVAQQRFRHDLYFRLHVVDLLVPPLRERPDDIPALAHALLARVAVRLRRSVSGIAPDALTTMLRYHWPGNVRELEHAIERACIFATSSQLELEDLPDTIRTGTATRRTASDEFHETLRGFQRAHILAALDRHHGDRRLTAQALGISLSTLKRRLSLANTTMRCVGAQRLKEAVE